MLGAQCLGVSDVSVDPANRGTLTLAVADQTLRRAPVYSLNRKGLDTR